MEKRVTKFITEVNPCEMLAQEMAIYTALCAYLGIKRETVVETPGIKLDEEAKTPVKKTTKKTSRRTKKVAPVVITYDRLNVTHTQELLNYLNSTSPNWSQDGEKKKKVTEFSKGVAKDVALYDDSGAIHKDFTSALNALVA